MFRLSKALGKQLHETMGWRGPITWRQMEAWNEWIDTEEERPGLTEWYLMQCAAETRRLNYILAKDPPTIPIDSFRLKFQKARKATKDDEAQRQQASKSAWAALLGSGKIGPRPTKPK